jgi:hypothetical protein
LTALGRSGKHLSLQGALEYIDRTQLDPRTTEIPDRIVDFSKLVRIFANDRPSSNKGIRELVGQIGA